MKKLLFLASFIALLLTSCVKGGSSNRIIIRDPQSAAKASLLCNPEDTGELLRLVKEFTGFAR